MCQSNRIIVVGGNAAGPAAAAKAKRVNPNAEVILFEAGDFISTGTCELPYLFSGEIKNYNDIVFFTPETFLSQKGVKVFTNHLVTYINSKLKEIVVTNKRNNSTKNYTYDKLILTTGSVAKEIPELPFSLNNVFSLKSVSDYLKIKGYMNENNVKNILIIGSGYIGLEVADTMKSASYDITIFDKETIPFPSSDIETRHLILELMGKNNIRFLGGKDNTRFLIRDNSFYQLKHDGRYIEFDMAIVAVGVLPNNALAQNIGLNLGKHGGLIVDNRLKTSNPNIYAAGDNIEFKNFITKKYDYIPLATHARNFGYIAGENAVGGNKIADPIIPVSAFKFCNKFVAQVGLSEQRAKDIYYDYQTVNAIANNKVKVMPNSGKVFGKIIYEKQNQYILGASFIGNQEVSGYTDLISTMIYNKISAKKLSKHNYNYTPSLSPFVNLLSVLGKKIEEK